MYQCRVNVREQVMTGEELRVKKMYVSYKKSHDQSLVSFSLRVIAESMKKFHLILCKIRGAAGVRE